MRMGIPPHWDEQLVNLLFGVVCRTEKIFPAHLSSRIVILHHPDIIFAAPSSMRKSNIKAVADKSCLRDRVIILTTHVEVLEMDWEVGMLLPVEKPLVYVEYQPGGVKTQPVSTKQIEFNVSVQMRLVCTCPELNDRLVLPEGEYAHE